MALIKDNVYRWEIWIAIFNALPALVKKDRDNTESSLFILFPEFQSYIENASIDSILRLTNTLKACEKLNYIFTNKVSFWFVFYFYFFHLYFLVFSDYSVIHTMRFLISVFHFLRYCSIIENGKCL